MLSASRLKCRRSQPASLRSQLYAERRRFQIIPGSGLLSGRHRILGEKVYPKVTDIPGEVDMVNVFRARRTSRLTWKTSWRRNHRISLDRAGQSVTTKSPKDLLRLGIKVVQDRCLMVDHRRFGLVTGSADVPARTEVSTGSDSDR